MKTILFKGKRKDNGEWIEGHLVKLGRESFSDPERYGICNKAVPLGGSGVCYNLKIDEVIPETVGQFTGLTDCKGNEIWEHDLIHFVGFNHTAEVIWSECNYAFMVVREKKHSYFLHDVIKVCRIERIGNKFDKRNSV